jgi:hypothetical protein
VFLFTFDGFRAAYADTFSSLLLAVSGRVNPVSTNTELLCSITVLVANAPSTPLHPALPSLTIALCCCFFSESSRLQCLWDASRQLVAEDAATLLYSVVTPDPARFLAALGAFLAARLSPDSPAASDHEPVVMAGIGACVCMAGCEAPVLSVW